MNGIYTVYKRDASGLQGDMIPDFTLLDITLCWKERSKWMLEGVTTGSVPLTDGDAIIIYRNGQFFLGCIAKEVSCECPEPETDVKYWTANGEDDTLLLAWRQVLADPAELTFEKNTYDQVKDTVRNRLIHYIRNCLGEGTVPERRLSGKLRLPSMEKDGDTAVSAYRAKALDKVLAEIGAEGELYPYLTRDDRSIFTQIRIRRPRDKTADIVISPEFGNVAAWTRKEIMPEFNSVWVVSGDYEDGRLYVYAEDEESVRKYGRIEAIVQRTDVAPREQAEAADETDEEGKTTALTEEDVLDILRQEAKKQLKEHGRKRTWSIQAAETREMAFMDDWQIGDLVTCVIDREKFESQITEVKISYEKGIETVEPVIGDIEKGLFGKVFDMIEGLDNRITNKENEK